MLVRVGPSSNSWIIASVRFTVNSPMAANWSDRSRMLCRRGERKPKPLIRSASAVSKHEADNRELKKKKKKES